MVVPAGLDAGWVDTIRAAGYEVLTDSRTDPVPLNRLDTPRRVVTAARVAIADTGTIVLDGAEDQGRRAITLVPDHHICVVRADQIVGTVPEGVALLAADRPQTWISGPSATSDIELSRVEGYTARGLSTSSSSARRPSRPCSVTGHPPVGRSP